jgi:transposase InsO family protein
MLVGLVVSRVVGLAFRCVDRQAGNRHRLAPSRIPLVLDLEDPSRSSRTTTHLEAYARSHSHHELDERALGSSSNSQRAHETWSARLRSHDREVHGPPERPPSQTWRAFLTNHVSQLASVDFFTVPTIWFEVLFVFVVLAHDRRRILHFNVTAHPTAEWTSQQMLEAFPFDTAPKYLLRDRDRIYGDEFRKRLEVMGIKEILSAPRSPWQRAYVERVIGSIRRECLDHVIVFNEESLRHTIRAYIGYYHRSRLHLSLDRDSPDPRPVQSIGAVIDIPEVGGLHHRYERRAA